MSPFPRRNIQNNKIIWKLGCTCVYIRMRQPKKKSLFRGSFMYERDTQLYRAMYQSGDWFIGIYRPEMEPHGKLQKKVASLIAEPKPLTGWRLGWIRTHDREVTSKHWKVESSDCYLMPTHHFVWKYEMWLTINLRCTPQGRVPT